jgi:HSP20 family protein
LYPHICMCGYINIWRSVMPCSIPFPIKLFFNKIGGIMLSLWKSFDSAFDSFYGVELKNREDKSLDVTIDLPGIDEKDINVEITPDNFLKIKGERKTKISTYSVSRSFYVPKHYDTANILADLKNGVLTLTLPSKSQTKEGKKIVINSK